MKLSDGEKLILAMLADVYKHLKIKGEIDAELVRTSICDDQTWGLRWAYPGIFHEREQLPPVVKETCDILDMYRLLTSSFEKLSGADQKRVRKEAQPFDDYIKYQGFDGNNDEHCGVVRHLVKHLDRYQELKSVADLNSHSSATLGKYRRMLSVYRPMVDPFPSGGLSADQIIQILKA